MLQGCSGYVHFTWKRQALVMVKQKRRPGKFLCKTIKRDLVRTPKSRSSSQKVYNHDSACLSRHMVPINLRFP